MTEWRPLAAEWRAALIRGHSAMRQAPQPKQLKKLTVLIFACVISISSFVQSDAQTSLLVACALIALVTGLAAVMCLRSCQSPVLLQSCLRAAPLLSAVLFFAAGSICVCGQTVSDGNQTGFPVFGTFHGSDLDTVLLSGGNLHIEIPIASFPQRHGQFGYKFVYDSPSYTLSFYRDPTSGLYWDVGITPDAMPIFGGRLTGPFGWGLGYTEDIISCSEPSTPGPPTDYTNFLRHNYVLHDPNGTKHPLALSYTY
ncbi:MAG TPA: hypothetical protein VI685_02650, partial [Candidatus Angelobacter sp.]